MNWSQIPSPVKSCCAVLWDSGYEALPVGGCVRDTLLGRTPGDWDVTTSAPPEAVMALFAHTVPTGLRHGTVTVLQGDMALEVTTFRREEGYADGRHPDRVTFDASLCDDLSRRDFTINAMALAPDGTICDPFGGQADLAHGLIRCVGEADRRLREDALRLLRGVRFAAQLGFRLEAETDAALHRNAGGLDQVSGERIQSELEKILLSPSPALVALPVELGMLRRFGAPANRVNLSSLAQLPLTPEHRWRGFCLATGLDITLLPIERRVRRFVLREGTPALALTGRDLYDLGLRGGEIGMARRELEALILRLPEQNTRQALLDVIKKRRTPPA